MSAELETRLESAHCRGPMLSTRREDVDPCRCDCPRTTNNQDDDVDDDGGGGQDAIDDVTRLTCNTVNRSVEA